MRFSAIFQLPAVPAAAAPVRDAAPKDRVIVEPVPAPQAAEPEVPDDLDVRVRMVGEWQLGEGY